VIYFRRLVEAQLNWRYDLIFGGLSMQNKDAAVLWRSKVFIGVTAVFCGPSAVFQYSVVR